jgi:hypothetical protein
MPPFGTNDILSAPEVADIAAYLLYRISLQRVEPRLKRVSATE